MPETITFQLQKAEAEWTIFRNRCAANRQHVHCLKLLLMASVAFWLATHSPPFPPAIAFALGVIFAFVAVSSPLLLFHAIRKKLHDSPEITSHTNMTFDDERVVLTRGEQRVETPWTAFRNVTEDKNHICLHVDSFGGAVFVPRRSISESQKQQLLSHAKTRNA